MPTVSIDRRGLNVGGRRQWLVSGTIDPARIPAELWEDRLDSAAAAGLNTVLVPAVWSAYAPREGVHEFAGDRDIARFVRLAGERGLMVILRPGPFQGDGLDRGGIPAWVDAGVDEDGRPLALRSSSPAFLSACFAWIRALCAQIKALQATEGGPIVLVQNEHRWFCADPEEAGKYLGELHRYLREGGVSVPIVNSNNLYATGEGETEGWNGHSDLLATFRQLRAVRPDQTCMALDFEFGRPGVWGAPASTLTPSEWLHSLAQGVAAGAQVNIASFASGTRFGFTGGRLAFSRDAFVAPAGPNESLLDEAGSPRAELDALRPLLLFTSSFSRSLAGVDWDRIGSALAPQPASETVVHAPGEHGSFLFVLRDPNDKARRDGRREILLPDGQVLTVDMRESCAIWCPIDIPIGPNSRVDFASASALWSGPRALALMAPAGATVEFSINGSAMQATPSRGMTPTIVEHEGVTVAVLNSDQSTACAVTRDGLLIGGEREGVARKGWKKWTLLRQDGAVEHGKWEIDDQRASRRTLSAWTIAGADAFVTGKSQRFAVIDGPATLDDLGVGEGYGWLRWKLSSSSARKVKALLPESGDRVHLFARGEPAGVLGVGPGAQESPVSLPLIKGDQTFGALVDNLGRPSGGWSDSQRAGVWGPLYEVKAFKAGKPTLESDEPLRPLDFRTPLSRVHGEETTHAQRVAWSFMHRRKSPILFRAGAIADGVSGLLVVNGEVVAALNEGSRADIVLRQDAPLGALRAGKNVVQFAPLSDPHEALKELGASASFLECVADLTEDAEWGFARWEMPANKAFNDWDGSASQTAPTWWRATFPAQTSGPALAFDPKGLTKGQLFLNGRNVGRYFVATNNGKNVESPRGLYLPAPWLRDDAPNEITIFDEHGGDPTKCRVVPFEKLRG